MAGYRVAPCGRGNGLIATRAYDGGETIVALGWGQPRADPTRWTVQIGPDEHAEPLPHELRHLNHSCDPNVRLDIGGRVVRALRDIAAGKELCFSYLTCEWEMAVPFQCACGSARCAGWIAGAATADPAALEGHVLSPAVRDRIGARAGLARSKARP